MRKENVVLLVICGLIAGGIGLLLSIQLTPRAALNKWATGLSGGAPPVAMAEETAAEPMKPETPKVRKIAVGENVPSEPAAEPARESKAEAAVVPPPQPELSDISTGMPRNALLERYPAPAIQTSTLRDGNLMELLVYQKKGAPVATYAQLENGAVTKVYAGIPARRVP